MDIRDLETNECRFFLCGTKFSDVLEDTVRAATLEELQVSNKLFLLKCENTSGIPSTAETMAALPHDEGGKSGDVFSLHVHGHVNIYHVSWTQLRHGRKMLTFGHYYFKRSHIAVDDKDRPTTSKEISNLFIKQPPTFSGKVEIVNETKRQEKNPLNSMDKTITWSSVKEMWPLHHRQKKL
ncbi:unnamed protein product [Clavelina lepadiformis]|uniref:Uncharacterized protein n=1 Tax=Clavelina lepadiformis TaxID=159417 RepID=A0ABP0G0Y2_CLALP